MTAAERGVLLLCSALGDPQSHPLTMAQFRELSRRMAAAVPEAPAADVGPADLLALGYDGEMAARIAGLLSREERLERYLGAAAGLGIFPLTRVSQGYPKPLVQKRGTARPPVFFCAGNQSLLKGPFVGLAGSRHIGAAGAAFAMRVGELAATEGFVLVTGGAGGADAAGLHACLRAGGRAVVFVPDELRRRVSMAGSRCLVCSEGGYDLPFSVQRAMMRNADIHMMGDATFIAHCEPGRGGTWNGALENLRCGWSRLYVYADGSPGAAALAARGALPVKMLSTLAGLI